MTLMQTGIFIDSPSGIHTPWEVVNRSQPKAVLPRPARPPTRTFTFCGPLTLCTVPKTPEPSTLSFFSSVSLKTLARTLLAFSLGSRGSMLWGAGGKEALRKAHSRDPLTPSSCVAAKSSRAQRVGAGRGVVFRLQKHCRRIRE